MRLIGFLVKGKQTAIHLMIRFFAEANDDLRKRILRACFNNIVAVEMSR